MKIFAIIFNGREGYRISVGVNEEDRTCIYLPGVLEPVIVTKDAPIDIDISGNSPGPDVAVMVEVMRS